jgi:hypothetical protein
MVRKVAGGETAIDVVGLRAVSANDGSARLATFDRVVLELDLLVHAPIPDAVLGVSLTDGRPGSIINFSMLSEGTSVSLDPGRQTLVCRLEALPLLPSAYEVWFAALSAERARYYAQPTIVGSVVIADGPANRKGDVLLSRTDAFGPVCVPFEMSVLPAGPVEGTPLVPGGSDGTR